MHCGIKRIVFSNFSFIYWFFIWWQNATFYWQLLSECVNELIIFNCEINSHLFKASELCNEIAWEHSFSTVHLDAYDQSNNTCLMHQSVVGMNRIISVKIMSNVCSNCNKWFYCSNNREIVFLFYCQERSAMNLFMLNNPDSIYKDWLIDLCSIFDT